jgi:hypothetical protein
MVALRIEEKRVGQGFPPQIYRTYWHTFVLLPRINHFDYAEITHISGQ